MSEQEIIQWFEEIVGFKPYTHQIKVSKSLWKGKSVLLRAPTGSGKTEAALIPFLKLRKTKLPSRMIYSLPLRVLVEDIGKRASEISQKLTINLSIHHGERVEDPMFQNDIIITTIDQTIASYACVPLSFSIKHGNIPASAIATSFLVFDEIQLLEAELGLQALLVIAKHSVEMGFPVLIMTATLPSIFIEKFTKELPNGSVEIIDDVKEEEISARKDRCVGLYYENNLLTAEEVLKKYEMAQDKKMIIICNTVRKAQEIYKNLNSKISEKWLLHSRFLNRDRKCKEEKVREIFGKNGKGEGILITTQVIEAGMDISSYLILTEVAPIDSIIQRAGRCTRWGGKGKFFVYEVEDPHPYQKELVEKTKRALQKNNGRSLNWNLEKSLVDEVLTEFVEKHWMNLKTRGNIIALLSEAAFEGNREKASKAVRNEFSCEVSLCADPYSLGDDVVRLEKIRVPFWTLKRWVEEYQPKLWEVEESNIIDDNIDIKWSLSQVRGADVILPFKHYILYSEKIGYNKELGLVPNAPHKDFSLTEYVGCEQVRDFSYETELWVDHSGKACAKAEELLNFFSFEFSLISHDLKMEVDDFKNQILTVVKLHDLGKLNKKWQKLTGWDGKNPIAHTNKNCHNFPPHATVSAYALSKWAYNTFKDEKVYEAILLAIAHHHSLRSSWYEEYCFINNWKDVLYECNIDKSIVENILPKGKNFHLPAKFPDFKNVKLYRTYLFISRILKFADWKSIGGDKCPITY